MWLSCMQCRRVGCGASDDVSIVLLRSTGSGDANAPAAAGARPPSVKLNEMLSGVQGIFAAKADKSVQSKADKAEEKREKKDAKTPAKEAARPVSVPVNLQGMLSSVQGMFGAVQESPRTRW